MFHTNLEVLVDGVNENKENIRTVGDVDVGYWLHIKMVYLPVQVKRVKR